MKGGLLRIREALPSIKPAELNVAHYILKNPDEIITLSVSELAERSESSQAAIIRMCKHLGLEGFKELKLRIAGDLQSDLQNGTEEYAELKPNDDVPTYMKIITENNIQSLRDTLNLLDTESVKSAVEAIYRANRIDFYGVGASQLIAQDAQQKFMRISKHTTAYNDTHLQLTSAVTLTSQDVAVGISYSGETSQTLTAMEYAKKTGATLIAVTRYGTSPLNQLADISLTISSKESDIRSAATSSRIAQLNVIDILFTAVAAKNYEQSKFYLKRSRDVLKKEFSIKK